MVWAGWLATAIGQTREICLPPPNIAIAAIALAVLRRILPRSLHRHAVRARSPGAQEDDMNADTSGCRAALHSSQSRLSPSLWERTKPAGRSSAAATVPRHAARRNFSHKLRRMSEAASTGRVVFAKAAPTICSTRVRSPLAHPNRIDGGTPI